MEYSPGASTVGTTLLSKAEIPPVAPLLHAVPSQAHTLVSIGDITVDARPRTFLHRPKARGSPRRDQDGLTCCVWF